MKEQVLLALIDALVSDAVSKIQLPEGIQGPRGLRGKDGNSFNLSEHKEEILKEVLNNIPKTIDLTLEQIEMLKGKDGQDGRDGRNGKDGRDFIFDDHKEEIESILSSLKISFDSLTEDQIESLRGPKGKDGKSGRDGTDFIFEDHREEIQSILSKIQLKFESLTEDQIESLRGPKGKDGKDGNDFNFESNKDEIDNTIVSYIDKIKDILKLRFSDLSEEDKDSLRGPRGQRGKPGKDFELDEVWPKIEDTLSNKVSEIIPELKRTPGDLTPEEISNLKLKFSDLTEEERLSLKGVRGQRGKIGDKGSDGATWNTGESDPSNNQTDRENDLFLNTSNWNVFVFKNGSWELKGNIRGSRGAIGPKGIDGKDGKNGLDGIRGLVGTPGKNAPSIVDITIKQSGLEIVFVFLFSDGSEIESSPIDLPKPKGITNVYNYVGGGSGSTATGGTGETVEKVYSAAQVISALKLVKAVTMSQVDYGTKNLTYEDALVFGLSKTAGGIGDNITVVTFGPVSDASFVYPVNTPLFLGNNGDITTLSVTDGEFNVPIGHSLGVGSIFINIDKPILI